MNESHEQQLERMLRAETTGEFTIEKLLGKGGMALVYLATEVHLDRKIAIKVLPPELTFGHGVERFKREAKTAAALDHPHIIPIHRIASGGKLFWYTMKYVEGRSLEDHLKQNKKLSLEETTKILEPVADALDYAHENQVIHRDIKPANVMLDERNRVTVADFGIAKALTEATLTASGSVIGTPYYMSPEQGMGKPVSGQSDQYSVAVMAYRMLSGQVPFDGESAIDILHKHCKEPPPPLEVLLPGQPRYVYAAIDKALSKHPDDRFSTVSAFVKGLKSLSPEISAEMETIALDTDASLRTDPTLQDKISTEVIAIPDDALPPAEEKTGVDATESVETQKPARKMWLIALVAVVVVGGIGGGIWWSERPGPPDPEIQRIMAASENQTPAESTATSGGDVENPEPPPPAPTTGNVIIASLPDGGTVTVNGEPQEGTTFELDPGTYTIGLSAPNRRGVETEIQVLAGGELVVPFFGAAEAEEVTSGTVVVTGLPDGGEIRVNGRVQRQETFELERGSYTIRLSAPGYLSVEQRVDVAAGEGVPVRFTGAPLVASVSVSISNAEVTVGNDVNARARPLDTAGNTLTGRDVRWTAGNRSIATVTRNGVVRGVAPGTTTITATVEDQTDFVTVTVTPVAVGAVIVAPTNVAVFEGATVQMDASVEDGSGGVLTGHRVTWQSSDPNIATVSASGLVAGVSAGSATVTARSGGQTGRAALTVKAVEVAEEAKPQPPTPEPISGPEDLFEQAAPAGWSLMESRLPVVALYDSPLGTIRILRVRQSTLATILDGLRESLVRSGTALTELDPPERFTTAGGETLLVQRFNGVEGSGFNEARFLVILAAARNERRAAGVLAKLEYYADRAKGEADLRELLRSLRQ